MRHAAACLGLTLLVVLTGCNTLRWGIFRPPENIKTPVTQGTAPTTEQLTDYLNKNAALLKTLRCDEVRVTCRQGIQAVDLDARMICQQPRNFRMTANFLGKPEVDLGSNEQEFWYWIRRGDPAQIYCRYQDLDAGQVRIMPFPFQPDWVLETLGMGQYGPASHYQLDTSDPNKLKLIERTKSPQGKPVQKVIVFNRRPAQAPEPQITDFILVDEESNKEICSAHVLASQIDPGTGGMYPKRLELSWPEQRLSLKLDLTAATAGVQIPPGFPAFVRQPLSGIRSFNLASGQFDGQPTSIRRTSGLGMTGRR